MPRKSIDRPLPAAEFSKRFRLACDEAEYVPPKHEGRYVYIVAEYQRLATDTISIETVRKWHEGQAAPRPAKIAILSDILGCNPNWLQTGFGDRQGSTSTEAKIFIPKSDDKSTKSGQSTVVPIPLRTGLTVEIHGLPSDLTVAEAKKIANIITAYGVGG